MASPGRSSSSTPAGWAGCTPAGRRRRFRAWIFTAVRSRHRFVYPVFRETTGTAIEACEAAWAFFGGVFHVLIPDNTKAIVHTADAARAALGRGLPRVRAGPRLPHRPDPGPASERQGARRTDRARRPGRLLRRRGAASISTTPAPGRVSGASRTTGSGATRGPSGGRCEHFEAEERAVLLPAPSEPYDPPLWNAPKVGRDQYALVAAALYSLPTRWIGVRLRARADRATVRFYDQRRARQDASPLSAGRQVHRRRTTSRPSARAYALRDVDVPADARPTTHGEAVGRFAHALLDGPLPWTRMRRVYALLGLARRYGAARVDEACARRSSPTCSTSTACSACSTSPWPPRRRRPRAPTSRASRYLRPATPVRLAARARDPDTRRRPA